MTIAIELQDLLVLKNEEPLVNIPRLAIPRGETLGIMGPNGSGKTTLLKVLALLEKPSQGRVSILGQEIDYSAGNLLETRRKIAFAFQNPLFKDASVRTNVALGLKLRKSPKPLIKEKVHTWLERLSISHLAHRHPAELSTGERCRVGLAQVLVLEPEILLLDEPLASLAIGDRIPLLENLMSILQEQRTTALYATHDYSELSYLARQGLLLYQGNIIQEGTILDLVHRPRSAVAASLVGVDNIIPGQIGNVAEDEVEFHPDNTALRLYGTPRDSGLTEAFALIRSDEIELDVFPGAQWNAIEGIVTRIIPQASKAKVHLDCGFPLITSLSNRKLQLKNYVVGQEVTAVFDPRETFIVRKLPE